MGRAIFSTQFSSRPGTGGEEKYNCPAPLALLTTDRRYINKTLARVYNNANGRVVPETGTAVDLEISADKRGRTNNFQARRMGRDTTGPGKYRPRKTIRLTVRLATRTRGVDAAGRLWVGVFFFPKRRPSRLRPESGRRATIIL